MKIAAVVEGSCHAYKEDARRKIRIRVQVLRLVTTCAAGELVEDLVRPGCSARRLILHMQFGSPTDEVGVSGCGQPCHIVFRGRWRGMHVVVCLFFFAIPLPMPQS